MNPITQSIVASLARTGSRPPKSIRIVNGMFGKFDVETLLDALSWMVGFGLIAAYDGEEAIDKGYGDVRIWCQGDAIPELIAA